MKRTLLVLLSLLLVGCVKPKSDVASVESTPTQSDEIEISGTPSVEETIEPTPTPTEDSLPEPEFVETESGISYRIYLLEVQHGWHTGCSMGCEFLEDTPTYAVVFTNIGDDIEAAEQLAWNEITSTDEYYNHRVIFYSNPDAFYIIDDGYYCFDTVDIDGSNITVKKAALTPCDLGECQWLSTPDGNNPNAEITRYISDTRYIFEIPGTCPIE